ncbi:MAG: hypothetical protein GXO37_05655 [Chloroflexi bacterium]|nr:hypothetical protein [Chloroflexota bacterium]
MSTPTLAEPTTAKPVYRFWSAFLLGLVTVGLLFVAGAVKPPPQTEDRVRVFTRPLEFDHGLWTWDALRLKARYAALAPERFWSPPQQREVVLAYREVVRDIEAQEAELQRIYGDPNLTPEQRQAAAQAVQRALQDLYARRDRLAPLAEQIIQSQVASVLDEAGLTLGPQPLPPVLYHVSPLPWALVVSPREVIRQDAFVTLRPDLTLDDHIALEEQVAQALDVSTLVVPVGGVGTYPTMVMQTSDLRWQIEVVAHEWLHNYFDWHPLGWNYTRDPQVRTMNETAASIGGQELGRQVVARFYPELLPPPPPPSTTAAASEARPEPPAFDFQREMRITRERVDALLAQGRVAEAEAYMEARRRVFWEHGYPIRKLNQAYFAFYGAYADSPAGGAAGEDPVGAAVRALRAQSPDIGSFLRRIAWMGSFADLQKALARPEASP